MLVIPSGLVPPAAAGLAGPERGWLGSQRPVALVPTTQLQASDPRAIRFSFLFQLLS